MNDTKAKMPDFFAKDDFESVCSDMIFKNKKKKNTSADIIIRKEDV